MPAFCSRAAVVLAAWLAPDLSLASRTPARQRRELVPAPRRRPRRSDGGSSVSKPESDDPEREGMACKTTRRLSVTALVVVAYGIAATGAITAADDKNHKHDHSGGAAHIHA